MNARPAPSKRLVASGHRRPGFSAVTRFDREFFSRWFADTTPSRQAELWKNFMDIYGKPARRDS